MGMHSGKQLRLALAPGTYTVGAQRESSLKFAGISRASRFPRSSDCLQHPPTYITSRSYAYTLCVILRSHERGYNSICGYNPRLRCCCCFWAFYYYCGGFVYNRELLCRLVLYAGNEFAGFESVYICTHEL